MKRTIIVFISPPFIATPNRTIAANKRTKVLINSTDNLPAIFPASTVATEVGVMNNLASSPVSRSPATDDPIPIIQDIITVIPKTAGTRKSIYLISPKILLMCKVILS